MVAYHARRDFQEVLRRKFDGSIEKLLPLLSRIEETDRLIDQVVYRLWCPGIISPRSQVYTI